MDEATRARITTAWPDICARLARGEYVKDTLARYKLTDELKRSYLSSTPGARQEWDDAREASAEAFMDEAMQVARGVMPNLTDADGATRARDADYDRRVHVDTLKWAARIRNPRAYSDKSSVDVNVRTVDLTAIIRDANARLAAAREPRLIEQVRDQAVRALPGGAESMLAALL